MNCLPGAADPYVKMMVGKHQRVSKTVKNSLKPEWDEHFEFELDAACNELLLTVCELDLSRRWATSGCSSAMVRGLGSTVRGTS